MPTKQGKEAQAFVCTENDTQPAPSSTQQGSPT